MRKLKYTLVIVFLSLASITKSQNTGPVAPEAVGFEPVDVTDMVNLVSGDFTYVIPLLTVPSPEGGYPVALSYHGGVTMDQEASWVGLGWNINPGAINRKINGFPDDWKEAERITQIRLIGEDYEVQTVGVGVCIGSKGVLSVGLSYSWGDYKGFDGEIGLGYRFGDFKLGVQASTKSGFSASAGYGYSNSIGISVGQSGTVNVGLTNNISNSSIGVSFGSNGQTSVGVSIAGARPSLGSFNALDSDGLSTYESSFGMSIPIYCFYLSYDTYSTGWSYYSKEYDFCYGSLYSVEARNQMDDNDGIRHFYGGVQDCDHIMDTYEIPYDTKPNFKKKDLVKTNNLMFAAYDNYVVNGQGLSGRFSPQLFSETLLTGDSYSLDKNKTDQVYYQYWSPALINTYNVNPEFYFKNENVGYLAETPGTFIKDASGNIDYTGESTESTLIIDSHEYNGYVNDKKVAGNYIQYFTNKEIIDGDAYAKGFIENSFCNEFRDNSFAFDPDGIGGFMITTTDGRTYHYTLPVYQFEEFVRKNEKNTYDYFEQLNSNCYAYTWLLTAITGPDFIDRGGSNGTPNGIIDKSDYGYWIQFNYGKYTDGYRWQFPYDLEGETYLSYVGEIQWGTKQIYYLNSIESRTHKAYFVKKEKEDGLSSKLEYYEHTSSVRRRSFTGTNREYIQYRNRQFNFNNQITPLALSKIILVKKENIESVGISSTGNLLLNSNSESGTDENIRLWNSGVGTEDDYEYIAENKWLDKRDGSIIESINSPADPGTPNSTISNRNRSIDRYIYTDYLYMENNIDLTSLIENAIKVVELDHNYTLCKNTPNSNNTDKTKLTLQKLNIKGNKGEEVIPPYIFEYYMLGSNKYNEDNKDQWGFDENNPNNWSLKKIILPTGANIEVNYEQHSFKNEAIYGNRIPFITNNFIKNEAEWKIAVPCDMESLKLNKDYRIKGTMKVEYSTYEYDSDYPYYDGWWKTGEEEITQNINCLLRFSEIDKENNYIYFGHEQCFPNIGDLLDNDEKRLDKIYFTNSYIVIPEEFEQRGGGVRVSEIVLSDINTSFSTSYDYRIPETDYTSGTIMYSVYNIKDKYIPYATELPVPKVMYKYVTVKNLANNICETHNLYEFEVYKNVKTRGINFSIEDQIEIENIQLPTNTVQVSDDGNHVYNKYGRSTIIKDNLNLLGSLKSVSVLNNNKDTLNKEVYEYLNPDEITIGTNQETYNYAKIFLNYASDFKTSENIVHFNATSKISYPNVLKSKKTMSNGITQTEYYTKHDFYSGNVLQTRIGLQNGDSLKMDILPAYRIKDRYSSMGPKALNENNKNMLSQQAASISYIKDGENWKPTGISIQKWNNIWSYREYDETSGTYKDVTEWDDNEMIWRKHMQYIWNGDMNIDGTYLLEEFDDYDTPGDLITNWSNITFTDPNWVKVNEIQRYDHYSKPLQNVDIEGRYTSSKYDINQERTIASVANASYKQFSYTGFENQKQDNYVEGEVKLTSTKVKIIDSVSHTGDYCLQTYDLANAFEFTIDMRNSDASYTRPYKISLWSKINSVQPIRLYVRYKFYDASDNLLYSESETLSSFEKQGFGNWYLFDVITPKKEDITNLAQAKKMVVSVENGLSKEYIFIDDFRIHPIDAPMQSYVYDQLTDAVTAILNNNNIAMKYTYDDAGKLDAIYKEVPNREGFVGGFKKVSEHNYGYARPADEVFSIVSDITSTTQVSYYNENRTVLVFLDIVNNDVIARDFNANATLQGCGTKSLTYTIPANTKRQVTINWGIPSGGGTTKTLTISGDINAAKNIAIDATPAILKVAYIEPESSQASSHGQTRIKVRFKNIGGETGTWSNLKWEHYFQGNSTFSNIPGTISLGAGNTSTTYYSDYYYFSGSEDEGIHSFRVLDGNNSIPGNPGTATVEVGSSGGSGDGASDITYPHWE